MAISQGSCDTCGRDKALLAKWTKKEMNEASENASDDRRHFLIAIFKIDCIFFLFSVPAYSLFRTIDEGGTQFHYRGSDLAASVGPS